MSEVILKVENLKTHFSTNKGTIKSVDGVNFSVEKSKTLAIVGESGCGKSVTSLSILRLLDENGKIADGKIMFQGRDDKEPKNLAGLTEKEMRNIRGKDISMIFQEPMTSLNPVFKVGEQIAEVVILHEKLSKVDANKRAVKMLELVGIPRAEEVAENYPFQLSGGMRQRVMIAMALACEPQILIADEPTTALDVTIQAQILNLMKDLITKTGTSIMLITHDLGVVAQMADHVIVMYCGKVVEDAPVEILFGDPKHPYTQDLLRSIPALSSSGEKLYTIPGAVPNPLHLPAGCYYAPRCPHATDKCTSEQPSLRAIGDNHKISCWFDISDITAKEGQQ